MVGRTCGRANCNQCGKDHTAHHPAEAIPFLEMLVKSVPWDATYKLRLAEAQSKAEQPDSKFLWSLDSIARDASAPYGTRLKAAADLAQLSPAATFGAGNLGSKELDFIAHPTNPTDAAQPYFVPARIAATLTMMDALGTIKNISPPKS